MGRYILEPGQYEVAVNFTAEDNNPVNPWVGSWNLEPGAKYSRCFFIVQNSSDDLEEEDSF
ncbi:MAG: hypothetical protein WA865_06855 [Spirulinaceae cyanobacterium]